MSQSPKSIQTQYHFQRWGSVIQKPVSNLRVANTIPPLCPCNNIKTWVFRHWQHSNICPQRSCIWDVRENRSYHCNLSPNSGRQSDVAPMSQISESSLLGVRGHLIWCTTFWWDVIVKVMKLIYFVQLLPSKNKARLQTHAAASHICKLQNACQTYLHYRSVDSEVLITYLNIHSEEHSPHKSRQTIYCLSKH